jgi:hypothetical protein
VNVTVRKLWAPHVPYLPLHSYPARSVYRPPLSTPTWKVNEK